MMESLGHYLLRGRIALLGVSATEVYEGQDVRTGIEVLAFRPLTEEPPRFLIPSTLSWIDREENTWIAEIPVGSVQTSWLAGRVEATRLVQWVKQLLGVLKKAQEQDIPIGYILPELIWARGSRIWLGGVGVLNPQQKWDFAGLLSTVRVLAGDSYPALAWRQALEDYASGELEYAALMAQLEAADTKDPKEDQQLNAISDTAPSLEARRARAGEKQSTNEERPEGASSSLEARRARAGEKQSTNEERSDGASPMLEATVSPESGTPPDVPTPTELSAPELTPPKPATSKSLKVQVSEPMLPPPAITPPRRIRIEDRLEPPFEVVEPPPANRRAILLWLLVVPLLLLVGGTALWLGARTRPLVETTVYPVEFRLQPPGSRASIMVLEIPEGSKMPLNTQIAEVPGRVEFDQPGIYRIRIRVQGRAPVDSLIEVPNPGGVTINLR